MLTSVIIRIELRGDPSGEVYKRLHTYMQGELSWQIHLTSDDGGVIGLPHAMYSGSTEVTTLDLAKRLRDQITQNIWLKGAIVLVMKVSDWGQAGAP